MLPTRKANKFVAISVCVCLISLRKKGGKGFMSHEMRNDFCCGSPEQTNRVRSRNQLSRELIYFENCAKFIPSVQRPSNDSCSVC